MKSQISFLCSSALLIVVLSSLTSEICAKRGDESKYTKEEEAALVELRELVGEELYLDYMHRNEYLIPWLRTRQLNVNRATELLRANLKWRKEEKIDELENEEFPQFDKNYPVDVMARDKEGRPVTLFMYSSWDPRKAALSGQLNQLKRYILKYIFEVPQQLALREGQADGTNATQFIVLGDLSGYNLRQHACIRCLEIPVYYIQTYEAHYPQAISQTIGINVPRSFDPLKALAEPFFSHHFISNVHTLGTDKAEWKEYLDTVISPDQLPPRFGGTRSTRN